MVAEIGKRGTGNGEQGVVHKSRITFRSLFTVHRSVRRLRCAVARDIAAPLDCARARSRGDSVVPPRRRGRRAAADRRALPRASGSRSVRRQLPRAPAMRALLPAPKPSLPPPPRSTRRLMWASLRATPRIARRSEASRSTPALPPLHAALRSRPATDTVLAGARQWPDRAPQGLRRSLRYPSASVLVPRAAPARHPRQLARRVANRAAT